MEKAPGVLPSRSWLLQNGYGALYVCMLDNPEVFAHIEQRTLRTSVRGWVSKAEQLAKDHDGTLPGQKWLQQNEYSALARCILKYPEAFAHIKQRKRFKSTDDWVLEAERLAGDNEGVLPASHWLCKNSYSGLYQCMQKNPQAFAHVQRFKRSLSAEEWVKRAECLVKENNGVLPSASWLCTNRHTGLYNAMRKNPHLFSHIKQKESRRVTPEKANAVHKLYAGGKPVSAITKATGLSRTTVYSLLG